jgi:hypothetical protein
LWILQASIDIFDEKSKEKSLILERYRVLQKKTSFFQDFALNKMDKFHKILKVKLGWWKVQPGFGVSFPL